MDKLIKALKALPLIRFALMLGGGMVATIAAGHVQVWMAHGRFPDDTTIWISRIEAMKWFGLGCLGIIALVMVTLSWGKVERIKLGKGDLSAELDLDDDK